MIDCVDNEYWHILKKGGGQVGITLLYSSGVSHYDICLISLDSIILLYIYI